VETYGKDVLCYYLRVEKMVTINREVAEPPGEVVLVRFGDIEHMFPGVM